MEKKSRTLPRMEIQQLIVAILVLVVAGIAGMIGLQITESLGDQLVSCAYGATDNMSFNTSNNLCYNVSLATAPNKVPVNLEYNASISAGTGIANLTGQFPNIGLVVGAVVIITLLVAGFAFAFRGRGGF